MPTAKMVKKELNRIEDIIFVPEIDQTFIEYGFYNDIKKVINSQLFHPVYLVGHKGTGKSLSIRQACAELKREYIEVPITIQTDEDDLLGGFRLIQGETKWYDGPVVEAMRRGAILNLDEVDKASEKLMVLQPVLNGQGIFLKKIGKYVEPAEGFNVFATANTKGKGDDSGKYVTSRILDDAFFGRFAEMYEADYPDFDLYKKILIKNFQKQNIDCNDINIQFVECLSNWSVMVNKTYMDEGVSENVDIRALTHIVKSFKIHGTKRKALQGFCTKFDIDTNKALMELYEKIDIEIDGPVQKEEIPESKPSSIDEDPLEVEFESVTFNNKKKKAKNTNPWVATDSAKESEEEIISGILPEGFTDFDKLRPF